jgi:L-aspartate oxidase
MPHRRSTSYESLDADFLILGSGIAGLWAAIQLAQHGRVLVVTKKDEAESNTNYAQGGIAAVMSQFDSVNAHVQDTLTVGSGLAKPSVVRKVITAAPEMVGKLIEVGVRFTYKAPPERKQNLDLGLEGGHSAPRVVHAADLTGQEIERALVHAVMTHPRITLLVHHLAIDLILEHRGGVKRCVGAWVFDRYGRIVKRAAAPITILSTGGAGQVYAYTTNPEIATGDGVAMAYRAGCRTANMEFVQFHPTRLFLPGAGRFLISEALRGAGGKLRNNRGEFFMAKIHPLADLAPRDVVARAIVAECRRTKSRCAYLDMSHLKPSFVRERFPNIYKRCLDLGLDITKKAIPVIPAAHYMCGGVMTDLQGRTDLVGLWAAGEVACTGLHGANRLASNSLLEAMYFADIGSLSAARAHKSLAARMPRVLRDKRPPDVGPVARGSRHWTLLRTTMWNDVGIIRDRSGLSRAQSKLRHLIRDAEHRYRSIGTNADTIEYRSATLVGWLIAKSALSRRESRGLHERTDYPHADDQNCRHDTIITGRG